jgi:hypothetical protein
MVTRWKAILNLQIIVDLDDSIHLMRQAFRPSPLCLCLHHPAQIHDTTLGIDIDAWEIRETVACQFRLHGSGN